MEIHPTDKKKLLELGLVAFLTKEGLAEVHQRAVPTNISRGICGIYPQYFELTDRAAIVALALSRTDPLTTTPSPVRGLHPVGWCGYGRRFGLPQTERRGSHGPQAGVQGRSL